MMPIQINSLSSRNLKGTGKSGKAQSSGKAGGSKAPSGARGAASSGGGDRVDLTGDASKLQELEGRIADMPIVDAQKVEAVQQALATGSFTIDPQTAADKMLAMELSLP
ncbi:MAG: flagellar biosynthesis anti-sigma factor FlgM [Candidatus Thiodiazotropha sp. DIVDIV]